MDRSNIILKHSMKIFVISLFTNALIYVYKISMARSLGIRGYGLLSATEPFIIFTMSLFLSGIATAIAKYISEENARNNPAEVKGIMATSFRYFLPISIFLSIFLFFSADLIAQYIFRDADVAIILKIVFLIMPLESVWIIYNGIFLGYHKSPFSTYTIFISQLTVAISAILLVNIGLGVKGAAIGIVLGDITGLIYAYIAYRKEFRATIESYSAGASFATFKRILFFAIPKAIATTGMIILMSFDILCLMYIQGAEKTALYNTAVPLSRVILIVSRSLALPLLAAVSEASVVSKENINKYLTNSLKYVSVVALPLLVIFCLIPSNLLCLFFGEEYIGASQSLVILSFGMTSMAYFSILSTIFHGMDKPNEPMKIILIAGALNIVLNVILIPKYSVTGAAAATSICAFLILITCYFKLKQCLKFTIPLKIIGKSAIYSLVIIPVYYTVSPFLWKILSVGIGAIIYLGLVFKSEILTVEEIKKIIRTI